MRDKAVQILFILISLALGAAAQELLPPFGGAKAPLLIILALHAAFRDDDETRAGGATALTWRWAAVAAAAGAFEDALNGTPEACCALFAVLASAAARVARPFARGVPRAAAGFAAGLLAAPLHEVWLTVWGAYGPSAALPVRFFASALPASFAGAAVFAALPALERWAGFDGVKDAERRRR